jgi:hypothetical protein
MVRQNFAGNSGDCVGKLEGNFDSSAIKYARGPGSAWPLSIFADAPFHLEQALGEFGGLRHIAIEW